MVSYSPMSPGMGSACRSARSGSDPRLGRGIGGSGGPLSTAATVAPAGSTASQVPPESRSRPPSTPGWSGQCAPGGSQGRARNSSRTAASSTGQGALGRQRSRTVHTCGSVTAVGYVYLLLAITAEIIGTTLLKYTDGFTKLWPSVGSLAGYAVAFVLLAQTLKSIEVGVTYALWSGIGTAAIAVIGAIAFKEPVTAAKIAGIALIILGVILLNLGGGKSAHG